MNFSFSRFRHLFKLELISHLRFYLLGMASLAGILLACMFFLMLGSDGLDYENQQVIFTIGLFLSSSVFTTTLFRQFSQKKSCIQAVMLPVSNPERLAVALVFAFVLFPLVYIIIALSGLRLVNFIENLTTRHLNGLYMMNDDETMVFAVIYLYLQAMCMLGAIWFRKYTFVKTAAVVCIVMIGIQALNDRLGRSMISGLQPALLEEVSKKAGGEVKELSFSSAVPYNNLSFTAFRANGEFIEPVYYDVGLPGSVQIVVVILMILLPFFLLYITLLKLREQQI